MFGSFGFNGFGFGLRSGGVSGGSPTPTPSPFVPLPTVTSLAGFGDSITVGQAASAPENRWLNKIAAATGGSASLLNAGISGTVLQNSDDGSGSPRTNNGRDRFVSAILGGNKREMLAQIYGFNDARYVGSPSTFNVTQFENDLREVVRGNLIGGYTRDKYLLPTLYYISDNGLNTGSAGFSGQTRAGYEAYNAAISRVAEDYGLLTCDLYSFLRDNGYAATTAAVDNIHPNDAGMDLIFTTLRDRTFVANTRALPATVTATANVSDVTVSPGAVSGATSYEYALVNTTSYVAIESSSATLTGVSAGTYRPMARAVFSGGAKGPWAVGASNVTVTGAGAGTEVLTAASPATWTVPTGVTSITVHAIGSGGNGNSNTAGAQRDGGGGGAALGATFTVTPGETFAVSVAGPGVQAATTLTANAGATRSISVDYGKTAVGGAAGAGGLATSSTITGGTQVYKNNGGSGGNNGGSGGGAGGGGAGGPNGTGRTGGTNGSQLPGGGGGGANFGANGSPGVSGTSGGAGGANFAGSGGGAGATATVAAGAGVGGGGGGGGYQSADAFSAGANGGMEVLWTASVGGAQAGPSGGGGGSGNAAAPFGIAGNGGTYGGGGGGGTTGGTGGAGVIVIIY